MTELLHLPTEDSRLSRYASHIDHLRVPGHDEGFRQRVWGEQRANVLSIDVSHPDYVLAQVCEHQAGSAYLYLYPFVTPMIKLFYPSQRALSFVIHPASCEHTMRVRTVRMVATLLRVPWCSSILITFFFGCIIS